MENNNNISLKDDEYKKLYKSARDYADLQLQLFKLNLVEKSSQILSFVVGIIAGALLLTVAFVYFSMIFVLWMKQLTGHIMWGFLIVGALFILLFILFFLLRNKLIINPFIRKMSSILFKTEDEESEDELNEEEYEH